MPRCELSAGRESDGERARIRAHDQLGGVYSSLVVLS
jgi:hypothetical protein